MMKKIVATFSLLIISTAAFAGAFISDEALINEIINDKWTVYFRASNGRVYELKKMGDDERFLDIVIDDAVKLELKNEKI